MSENTKKPHDALRTDAETPGAAPLIAPEHSDGLHLEDERSPMEAEDDHSYTDFDLTHAMDVAEKRAAAKSGESAAPAPQAGYFPEDERSRLEHEDDHSDPGFDIEAEIAAKLGAAAPAAPSAADAPAEIAHDPSRYHVDESETYFPEDDRHAMDWEDDHSDPGIDLDAEIEAACAKAAARKSEAARNAEGIGVDDDSCGNELEHEDSGEDDGHHADPSTQHAAGVNSGREAAEGEAPGEDEGQKKKSVTEADAPALFASIAASDTEEGSGSVAAEDSAAREVDESGEAPGHTSGEAPGETPGEGSEPSGDSSGDTPGEGNEASDGNASGAEDDSPMSLREHLTELRKRLVRAFLFIFVAFFAMIPFAKELFNLLVEPLKRYMPEGSSFIFTAPAEAFFTELKVAFVAGFFVASPFIFYQLWAFIAPGLYREERRYIIPVAIFSALFFASGGAFCYYVVMPFIFDFFMSYNTEFIKALPKLNETLSFELQLLLAFGLVFELPLFVFFLARLGLVTADMMRRFRRYAVLLSVIVAAVLTPPDVMSQMLMAGPLLVLYEVSIFIAVIFGKKESVLAKARKAVNGEEAA